MSKRVTDRKLYIHLNDDEKHLGNSRRTPGAISGMDINNETGKGCGAAEFVEYEISERDYRRAEFIANTVSPVIERGMYAAVNAVVDRAEYAFYTHAMPKIEEGALAFRKKCISWGKAAWDGITGTKPKITRVPEPVVVEVARTSTTAVKSAKEKADQKQPISRATYDALTQQNRMLVVALARNIKFLSNSYVSESEDEEAFLEWNENFAEIATQDTMNTIQYLLENKSQGYLDEATEALFADFMAGMLVVNGEKVYISLPETIGKVSDAQYNIY